MPKAVGISGLCQMPPAVFYMCENRVLWYMKICKELRYNFDVESDQQILFYRID